MSWLNKYQRHHHHHLELVSDVAVSTSVGQAVLFCARRWAVARPRLSGRRSFSIVCNQVCLGRPGLHLQCLGRPVVLAYSAWEWSWLGSALQMWPKKRRHLERTASDSNGCWVLDRTSLLVMHPVQCIFRMRGRQWMDTIDQQRRMSSQPLLSRPKSLHHTERGRMQVL